MHFGWGPAPSLAVKGELKGPDLEPQDAFKYLGIVVSPDLKRYFQ